MLVLANGKVKTNTHTQYMVYKYKNHITVSQLVPDSVILSLSPPPSLSKHFSQSTQTSNP